MAILCHNISILGVYFCQLLVDNFPVRALAHSLFRFWTVLLDLKITHRCY